jgi:uroporphyrinogen decarboxylase
MKETMTANERVHATLRGDAVDRVPFCFWHHFRHVKSGEELAAATYEFFVQKFQLDIVKIMPDLPYPTPTAPLITAEQVRFLPRLDLDIPIFQEQLRCIQTLRARLGNNYPLLLTLFSPLTYMMRFMGRYQAVAHARKDPDPFEEGVATIASNLRKLMEAAIETGANGIFYSCMGATSAHFTREEYARFGVPYDLEALTGAKAGWLNTIHVHADPEQAGDQIYFDIFTNYPAAVISWSDHLTGPSLSEATTLTDKCLMGGLWERGPLTRGSETELQEEIEFAINQTQGHKFILANGCSIPDDTPEEWLYAACKLVLQHH